jgi:hypothetical protein
LLTEVAAAGPLPDPRTEVVMTPPDISETCRGVHVPEVERRASRRAGTCHGDERGKDRRFRATWEGRESTRGCHCVALLQTDAPRGAYPRGPPA